MNLKNIEKGGEMTMLLSWSVIVGEIMEDLAGFVKNFIRRVRGVFVLGYSITKVSDYLFDYVLYAWVIYKFGVIVGGVIMTILSACLCLVYFEIYDALKKDIFAIEAIKESGKESFIISWFLKKGKLVQFIGLSFWKDPFYTTAFLREESFNGLTRKDKMIFWGSVLLSNGFWVLTVFAGITLAVNITPQLLRDAGMMAFFLYSDYITRRV